MAAKTKTDAYIPRFKQVYDEAVAPALMQEFGYKNRMQIPRIEKIVVNMGVGEATRDAKILTRAEEDLAAITGQKPKRTTCRVSVAAFKVREGQGVGCATTLRGKMMYEFLERLVSIAIPRIRDFRGLPGKAFDGRGNYNFGIREHLIFLEIDLGKEPISLGMNVTIVTSAKTDAECRALLKAFGMPLRDETKN